MAEVLPIKLKDGYFSSKLVVVGFVEPIVGATVVIVAVVKDPVLISKTVSVVTFIEL